MTPNLLLADPAYQRPAQELFSAPAGDKKNCSKNKKQSSHNQVILKLHRRYFRPIDRLLSNEIEGQNASCEAIGRLLKNNEPQR